MRNSDWRRGGAMRDLGVCVGVDRLGRLFNIPQLSPVALRTAWICLSGRRTSRYISAYKVHGSSSALASVRPPPSSPPPFRPRPPARRTRPTGPVARLLRPQDIKTWNGQYSVVVSLWRACRADGLSSYSKIEKIGEHAELASAFQLRLIVLCSLCGGAPVTRRG